MIKTLITSIYAFSVLTSCASADPVTDTPRTMILDYSDRGAGDYTLVFEAGFGTDKSVWEGVIERLPDTVRALSYSRAGLGASPAPEQPRSIEGHISDLAALLETKAITSNIVLVGHSYGGLLAAEFAAERPDLVAGLVLVDPSSRHQRLRFKDINSDRIRQDDAILLEIMPPSMTPDYEMLITQMDSAAGSPTPLPADLPTILFTSTARFENPFVFEETEEGRAEWLALHQTLFSQVLDGSHIRVPDAGHNIHTETPDRVATEITNLIERLRKASGSAQ